MECCVGSPLWLVGCRRRLKLADKKMLRTVEVAMMTWMPVLGPV